MFCSVVKHVGSSERTEEACTVNIVSRRPLLNWCWQNVKMCQTIGHRFIIAGFLLASR